MYRFQEILDSTLSDIFADKEYEKDLEDLDGKVSRVISEVADEAAEGMLVTIKGEFFSGNLEKVKEDRRQFEERLNGIWGKPLDLLELFVILATEAGTDFNGEFGNDAVGSGDAVFAALIRLHARACQISSAILTLLRSGYADDAHARWRSLHEIAVVASFISKHGKDLAERYLFHERVQQYKLACEHQEFCDRYSDESLSQEGFDSLKREFDRLIDRFGKPFKEDYGWAASVLRPARPTFRAIEEHVNLDHLRPLYKIASDNVHANSHGANYRLGLYLAQEKVLLAGPSNARLADPGHANAVSLNQVTTTLLATRVSLDTVVVMKILKKLVDEIGETFLQSHQEFEAIGLGKRELET